MLAGETTSNIVDLIRGTEALRFKDGLMQTARNKAEALVRTSVQVVANEARIRTYESNRDVVKYIEWVSTLDSRTSSTCQVLDGKKWAVGTFKPIGPNSQNFPGPTAHWNCRSTQVPVLKSWEELGSKRKFDEIPSSTRSSMDGQVSSKISYEDWLKSKGQEFQKEVLGPGKFELWKAGKIGFKDLTNSAGNPLTVGQLQLKYADKPKPKKPAPVEILNEKGVQNMDEYSDLSLAATGIPAFDNSVLSRLEKEAVANYTMTSYMTINKHLRKVDPDIFDALMTDEYFDTIKNLDSLIERLPVTKAPMKLFRARQSNQSHKVGEVLLDRGFGSTSAKFDDLGFGDTTYTITVPPGSKVAMLANASRLKRELEVVLPRDSKIIITKATPNTKGGTDFEATLDLE